MIDFSIQLKTPSERESLVIIVAYSKHFKGHRFIYSTGIKVRTGSFNLSKPGNDVRRLYVAAGNAYQTLANDGSPINESSLKSRITLLRDRVQWHEKEVHVYLEGRTKGDPGTVLKYAIPDGLNKDELEKELQAELLKRQPDLNRVISRHISAGQSELFGFWQGLLDGRIKSGSGKILKKSTLSTKRQTKVLLEEYQNTLGHSLSFESMSRGFYNDFTRWLEVEKGLDSNTIGKHVKELKSLLNLAYANELMKSDSYRFWPVVREKNEVIALTREEILRIVNLPLSGTQDDVRDLFILACFLGPRISDYKQFTGDSLVTEAGVTFFRYVQEKTGSICKIPVHEIAMKILTKRQGQFPRMISEQNFRGYLKEILKKPEAELNDRVISKIRDGKAEYVKKWQALSPHSARRTFATSLFYGWFGRPMPASLCMRYTGHKTEKSFMLYIGATEKDLDAKALEYFDVKPIMTAS